MRAFREKRRVAVLLLPQRREKLPAMPLVAAPAPYIAFLRLAPYLKALQNSALRPTSGSGNDNLIPKAEHNAQPQL